MNAKCAVADCQRKRISPRNGLVFGTCAAHFRIEFGGSWHEQARLNALRPMVVGGTPA